jgi:hypothetical protein
MRVAGRKEWHLAKGVCPPGATSMRASQVRSAPRHSRGSYNPPIGFALYTPSVEPSEALDAVESTELRRFDSSIGRHLVVLRNSIGERLLRTRQLLVVLEELVTEAVSADQSTGLRIAQILHPLLDRFARSGAVVVVGSFHYVRASDARHPANRLASDPMLRKCSTYANANLPQVAERSGDRRHDC